MSQETLWKELRHEGQGGVPREGTPQGVCVVPGGAWSVGEGSKRARVGGRLQILKKGCDPHDDQIPFE